MQSHFLHEGEPIIVGIELIYRKASSYVLTNTKPRTFATTLSNLGFILEGLKAHSLAISDRNAFAKMTVKHRLPRKFSTNPTTCPYARMIVFVAEYSGANHLANEITIPALPCRSIDETLTVYVAPGFEIAYQQTRPNNLGINWRTK